MLTLLVTYYPLHTHTTNTQLCTHTHVYTVKLCTKAAHQGYRLKYPSTIPKHHRLPARLAIQTAWGKVLYKQAPCVVSLAIPAQQQQHSRHIFSSSNYNNVY